MVDRNDSFLREVNEDLRRDQMRELWEKHGILIVAAVVSLFVAVGAYKWWESRKIASQERTGARYEAAMRIAGENKPAEAVAAFDEIAKDAPQGYRTLARLRIAAEQAKSGKTAEALAAYESLAADTGADELLRDFAALQAAVLRLDQADWTEMKNRLTPLTDDKRPWHPQAREMLGVAAHKAGQTAEASKLYEQILGDRVTPSGLTRRAQEVLAVLTDAASAKGTSDKASDDPAAKSELPAKSGDKPAGK